MSFLLTLLIFFNFVIFCQVSCHSSHLNEPVTCVPWEKEPERTPRCGQVLTEPNGTIFYKPYEKIQRNERCVWALSVGILTSSNRPSQFNFHILYLGFPSSRNITGPSPQLLFTGSSSGSTVMESQIPSGTGYLTMDSVNSLIITFSSGSLSNEDYTGFIIQYTFTRNSAARIADYILIPPLKSSFQTFSTSTNALATFVVLPENNYYPGDSYSLIYSDNSRRICSSSSVNVYVYRFNRESTQDPWLYAHEFCAGIDTIVIPGYDDILLLMVRTGTSITDSDFTLFNMRCSEFGTPEPTGSTGFTYLSSPAPIYQTH